MAARPGPETRRRRRLPRSAKLLAVVAVVLAAVIAAAGPLRSTAEAKGPPRPPHDHPTKKGLVSGLGGTITVSTPQSAAAGLTLQGAGIPGAVGSRTLVLYDTSSEYGWLGELYAIATGNLVSHFGAWDAKPVASYAAGDMLGYTAVVYIGSTYDEPLPAAFLDDVWSGERPVVWAYDNIWELTSRYSASFWDRYGWSWSQFDTSPVAKVEYKGVALTRDAVDNEAGIMDYSAVDSAKATVLATAVRADGTRFPWALRSANLTYVGEVPFVYTTETDRLLAFEDILFGVLDPAAPERHRALVRLEDVSPGTDAADFKAAVDYLDSRNIPFGFGVTPVYTDPLAFENPKPTTIRLAGSTLEPLVRYALARGGTLVGHGYTHQYAKTANPYNGLTGDDFEFYRVVELADHSLDYVGPLPGDSTSWAAGRMVSADQEFVAAGAPRPSIFEFPHYAASAADYAAAQQQFGIRWDRALYFGHTATGAADPGKVIGQLFPFVVRDAYGSVVLPENIGNYEPEPFYTYPVHTVADMLAGADANAVVRDGFASFYYHPTFGVAPLRQTVEGLLARGWTFADPAELAGVARVTAPASLTPPSIAGTAQVGATLTASTGTWSGDPAPSLSSQWLRCDASGNPCAEIAGATGQTLTLQQADAGSTIRIRVTATNTYGSATATSAPTAVVSAPTATAPVNVSPPAITGTAKVGETLTATAGTWSGQPAPTFAYEWLRCDQNGSTCAPVAGATRAAYVLQSADAGATMRVRVTATNTAGSANATSAATAVVTAPPTGSAPASVSPPTIAGTAKVGSTLTASPGTWTGSPAPTFAYQWLRCDTAGNACEPIARATRPTYTIGRSDRDATIRVRVTATNTSGSAEATSAQTAVVGAKRAAQLSR